MPARIPDNQVASHFWNRVSMQDDCWIWTGSKHRKYGSLAIHGKYYSAHRFAWELTYGPIPEGLSVLHKCDNPPCCRPDHLFLGTQTDNYADMRRKGRENRARGDDHWTRRYPSRIKAFALVNSNWVHNPPRGERNHNAKLTEVQVLEIRRRREAGEHLKPLAKEFGVTFSVIHHIAARLTWRHLAD